MEIQREIAARLEHERSRREAMMLSHRGLRSCSEQGPHPGQHLWGPRRTRKRTSAPQMGAHPSGVRTALILRSRRSWPVAPVTHNRWVSKFLRLPCFINCSICSTPILNLHRINRNWGKALESPLKVNFPSNLFRPFSAKNTVKKRIMAWEIGDRFSLLSSLRTVEAENSSEILVQGECWYAQ